MDEMKEHVLIEVEAFWTQRMCELVTDDRLDDSDALYLEYCIDGKEPSDWLFMNDLCDVY
jgi:hypothetical protein